MAQTHTAVTVTGSTIAIVEYLQIISYIVILLKFSRTFVSLNVIQRRVLIHADRLLLIESESGNDTRRSRVMEVSSCCGELCLD